MALFKSNLLAQASGSLGGTTFSHNSAGMYMRSRSIPTNPNTSQQQTIRNAVSLLANRWTTILTEQQRDAWRLWAANVPQTNRLGDQFFLSGQQAYIQNNAPKLQASNPLYTPFQDFPLTGLAAQISDNAPNTFVRAETGPISITAEDMGAGIIGMDVTFDEAQPWANLSGGVLLLYVSRPQSPGTKFVGGPFRLAGGFLGSDGMPPSSPRGLQLQEPGYKPAPGQLIVAAAVASLPDGRTSARNRSNAVIVT